MDSCVWMPCANNRNWIYAVLNVRPRLHGDLEIYLDHNSYTEIREERYTRIYATRHTYWGLGPDRHYEIKAINGLWHIREHGEDKWTLMDFSLGMYEVEASESFYSR